MALNTESNKESHSTAVRFHTTQRTANEQTTGTATFTREYLGSRQLSIVHEPTSDVNKVIERILFAKILGTVGFFIPLATHFTATSNVGNDVNNAAIQQGQSRGTEISFHTSSIGPVAWEHNRRGHVIKNVSLQCKVPLSWFIREVVPHIRTIQMCRHGFSRSHMLFHDIFTVHQGDRNLGSSISCRDGGSFRCIQGRVISRDGFFFEHHTLGQIGHVNFDRLLRCHHGIVSYHQLCSFVFVMTSQSDIVGIFGKGQSLKILHGRGGSIIPHG
mmetsp:Transcript_11999/g.24731  ORF Transcript_11999/g.24731 Transcript_11999/m.24731 type:complete len:273 (-) Transcript_11999:1409-2227(-)